MLKAPIGTRFVLLRGGAFGGTAPVGVVIAERLEPYLKRFVVQSDSGTIFYASPNELALEHDPQRAPLGPPMHDD